MKNAPLGTNKSSLVAELPKACADESAAVEFMQRQRWGDTPACPRCGDCEVMQMNDKDGNRNKRFLWRCKGCKKQFTVRVGTIMEDSPIPLRFWCLAFYRACASKKGISALQIKRETGLTYKSALFMLHRIRYAMAPAAVTGLDGTVEIDQTLVGGKRKVRHTKEGRRIDKGTRENKTCALAMVQRDGNVRTQILSDRTAPMLMPTIMQHVKPSARIMTDEWIGYHNLKTVYASHEKVNHSAKEYARRRYD